MREPNERVQPVRRDWPPAAPPTETTMIIRGQLDDANTMQLAAIARDPDPNWPPPAGPPPDIPQATPTEPEPATPSLAAASSSMLIANLVSRITGFVRFVMLGGIIGFTAVNDSYTLANNFPNIVYELLFGGVLAAVVVPTLVRAQEEDADRGESFTQRLLTVALVMLIIGTTVAVACSPLLTKLYFSSSGQDVPALTTALTYLIMPEILFYGIFGLVSGILNARHSFKAPAWASVVNNLVMFATLGVYAAMPGEISLNPVKMGDPKLLVLGIGTTLGIVVQALVTLPALRKIGFRFRWRWGWDKRLSQFGRQAGWLVVYTLISQVGYVAVSQIATAAAPGSYAIYASSWNLIQVPYGVVGVSLLTAIMPRLSKAAATGDTPGIVENLSIGTRMVSVMLIPLVALMTVLGPEIGQALFSVGKSGTSAVELGLTLTASSFGIVCYAITLLQLRVFYAMNDGRTPTLINVIVIAVRLVLVYLAPTVLDAHHIVYGLVFANGVSYLIGAIVGMIWLRYRIGHLGMKRMLTVISKVIAASIWCAASALVISKALLLVISEDSTAGAEAHAWLSLLIGTAIGLPMAFGLMKLLRVSEVSPAFNRISRLLKRG
jgi:putative peptidoglycan lipid II flippase